jgi:hypothetical protein
MSTSVARNSNLHDAPTAHATPPRKVETGLPTRPNSSNPANPKPGNRLLASNLSRKRLWTARQGRPAQRIAPCYPSRRRRPGTGSNGRGAPPATIPPGHRIPLRPNRAPSAVLGPVRSTSLGSSSDADRPVGPMAVVVVANPLGVYP